jgi:hypothetical protein
VLGCYVMLGLRRSPLLIQEELPGGRVDFLLLKVRLEESGSVVVKALCYKLEGYGFETQRGE